MMTSFFNKSNNISKAKEVLCLKRRLFSLAVCLFLFVGLFSVSINIVKSAAGDGIVEVDLNVRGTFLRAMDDWPYFGPGDYEYDENLELQVGTHTDFRVEEPTIIDLQAEGFNEGDKIYISWLGGLYPDGAWNPANPGSIGYGLRENDDTPHGGLLGLFSTTSTLDNDLDSLNRVPGAIDYGEDYFTPDTWWQDGRPELSQKLQSKGIDWYTSSMKTDIPEDFQIFPYTGMKIEVPRNAKFLFLSLIDAYYRDNYEGPKGLVVTIEKDTDEDGIPDHWEINGIDSDKDGTIDLDLAGMGADWEHKDIFVEFDWGNFGGHNSYYWPDSFVPTLEAAFAKAPVKNPDNVDGINLHIIYSQDVGTYPESISWNQFQTIKETYFGDSDDKPETVDAKKLVFHYCLKAYKQVGGSSGKGEWPGNDFLITLGDISNLERLCATFMHELGHNLGLHHGGNEPLNYKPNYISVMNYMFQLDSYGTGRSLDFSGGNHNPLVESNLNENNGIGEAVKTVWRLTNGSVAISDGNLAIDWNVDGNIAANVQMNLNNFPQEPNSNDDETLRDYNDWENLFYRFRSTSAFASGAQEDTHTELTLEEIEAMDEEAKNIIEVPIPESEIVVNEDVSVGVKGGDWMEYSVSYDGNPSDDHTNWFRVEVEKVEETNITAHFEVERINGEKYSFSETYDLKVGFHDAIIISSGLDLGDQFFHDQFGSISIEYIEDYGYAGEERTVVAAIFSDNIAHWDKNTGVLTQLDWSQSPDLKHHWLIEKTSLWGETGIDIMLLVGFGIAIVAVLLIILLFFRRKKKKSENEHKL
jgi:hypothetical protein